MMLTCLLHLNLAPHSTQHFCTRACGRFRSVYVLCVSADHLGLLARGSSPYMSLDTDLVVSGSKGSALMTPRCLGVSAGTNGLRLRRCSGAVCSCSGRPHLAELSKNSMLNRPQG